MQLLEDRIRKDGKIADGDILKVDSFLNHQMDTSLFRAMAKEWHRLYKDSDVNKILTIEASGIGIACIVGEEFGCPVVFAKKSKSLNIAGDVYSASVYSYTHKNTNQIIVSKDFLNPSDRILVIDDFLANGAAIEGLFQVVQQAGAHLCGAGIAIEKAFQPGGSLLREKGIRIESLARIKSLSVENGIEFC